MGLKAILFFIFLTYFSEIEGFREAKEAEFSPSKVYGYEALELEVTPSPDTFYNSVDITNTPFYKNNSVQLNPEAIGTTRSGTLAKKIGMLTLIDVWGMQVPVTVLHIDRCQVIRQFTEEKNGFTALEIGAGEKYLGHVRKSEIGHFLKAGVPAKTLVKKFDLDLENLLPVGFQLSARHYTVGQYVDVKGFGKNKGFSGAMEKWGFSGQSASHGTCKTHRSLGSTGQCQDAGRVWKGKKMHGQLGGHARTMRGLQVYRIDYDRNLIFVRGSVPGANGDFVEVKDSLHKNEENKTMLNHPTFVPKEGVKYANIVQVEAQEQDPYEQYLHDEALPKDDEE